MNSSLDLDERVLMGQWFDPRHERGATITSVALELGLREEIAAASLIRLQHAGHLALGKETSDGQQYTATMDGLRYREELYRARGQRHPALIEARNHDLHSLVIALVMAQVITESRRNSGWGGGDWRTMRELSTYLLDYAASELDIACTSLVEGGLLERLPAGHVQLTLRGRLRYDQNVRVELGLADDDSILDPPSSRFVFISYDTREAPLAAWLKAVLEARLPESVRAFVAKYDIAAGDDPMRVMLEENLLRAHALVALCSSLSRTSAWLWWESAAVWARSGLVIPLFVDVDPSDFKGPLTIVRQGKSISDMAELNATIEAVVRRFRSGDVVPPLSVDESTALDQALLECKQNRDAAYGLLRPVPSLGARTTIRVLGFLCEHLGRFEQIGADGAWASRFAEGQQEILLDVLWELFREGHVQPEYGSGSKGLFAAMSEQMERGEPIPRTIPPDIKLGLIRGPPWAVRATAAGERHLAGLIERHGPLK